MRESRDHPVKIKSIDNMTLFGNCFGKTFSGWDPNLKFIPHVACYSTIGAGISQASSTVLKSVVKSATVDATVNVVNSSLNIDAPTFSPSQSSSPPVFQDKSEKCPPIVQASSECSPPVFQDKSADVTPIFQASSRSSPQVFSSNPSSAKKTNSRTCLLYTSPSPRDATLSRMPSSA